jgi:hypothetical protein
MGRLNVQGTRPATSYADWAAGHPLLADPDADGDHDGSANAIEYGSGTDGLDPLSRPLGQLGTEDLSGLGFTDNEIVFSYVIDTQADETALVPATSTDLVDWFFSPLEFLDAAPLDGSRRRLRFRLGEAASAARYFRFGDSRNPEPTPPSQ